ncbi:hypothetical protein HUJ04_009502 [Dendroctonus ponderosae]|nr:hypothetical protein HUJ04_009502 [Dendroctonus ponderosae]
MRLKLCGLLCTFWASVAAIPAGLLYDFEVPEVQQLPRENDVSSDEIPLQVAVKFYGLPYKSIYVNSNGFLSFQTEIPHFINMEFPLDYPIIAPFYSNVDTSAAGTVSYYETQNPHLLNRATENVHENFLDDVDFEARSLFIATWNRVGYFNQQSDKLNTYQVVLISDGSSSYVEFLYPQDGLQWIQGTGDESGLPDARAQVGFLSPDGKKHTLPGSATEQVSDLEKWSNIGLTGQFLYKISGKEIVEPDQQEQKSNQGYPATCAEVPTACHSQGTCINYKEGFCCACNPSFVGNGKFCVKEGAPLRVNGKVNGKLNGERLENLDLHVVTVDGRAYTAISKIPESIGADIQTLQVLGSVIGYLFAHPVRGAINGFQRTGGLFNHTSTVTFLNTSQVVQVNQKFLGLDVFDHLKLEINVQGDIPTLPIDARVVIDEYQEQYTQTGKGLIQMTSERPYIFNAADGREITNVFRVEQTFKFNSCPFENETIGESWTLKVGRNFISYESREQIIRFGISNKITPIGDYDPCIEGRQTCGPNSACVVDGSFFDCICNPGYQRIYSAEEQVCADVNECQTNHECDRHAQCFNTVGSYGCSCNPGFEGDGRRCDPVSSCANISCTQDAECVENGSEASCRCLPGFRGDGYNCQPVPNQGCDVSNNCSPYAICSISPGSEEYSCSCHPGFEGDGYQCIPIPVTTTEAPKELTTGTVRPICQSDYCYCPEGFVMDEEASCKPYTESKQPSYAGKSKNSRIWLLDSEEDEPEVQCYNASLCFCPFGYAYSESRKTCAVNQPPGKLANGVKGFSPIKHDCRSQQNCDFNARCDFSTVLQAHVCTCNEGYEGDGFTCHEEQQSCNEQESCHANASCTYYDSIGKSICVCKPEFAGNGYSCSSSASCSSHSDCTQTEECAYQNGRNECVCREGHVRDSQHICVPTDGSCGGGTCVSNAECVFDEDYQTYYCTCKDGFIGDGITECRERPIGCDTLNNCGLHATCRYEEEAQMYMCRCNHGFFGDGFQCSVEKNCLVDRTMCDPNAQCLTDAGRSYYCQCNLGFVGDGSICREVSRSDGNFLLLNQGWATHKIPIEATRMNPGKPIQIKTYQTAVGLDIDCMESRVYWSDISLHAIRSSSYNGSDNKDFLAEGIHSPEGLALDWVSRNIYWTDSTSRTIEVANLDSKRRRELFKTGLVNPRDVSLPNALAIDYDTDQLCYSDAGTKKIECVQIDTRQVQTIAINCTYPFGITVTDRLVYWSDWISKEIERVDKFTLARLPSLNIPAGGSGNKLFGLVAVPNRCPNLTNLCQHSRCPDEHICLPDGKGSKSCLCSRRTDVQEDPSCTI